jgi:hypothetical protein
MRKRGTPHADKGIVPTELVEMAVHPAHGNLKDAVELNRVTPAGTSTLL